MPNSPNPSITAIAPSPSPSTPTPLLLDPIVFARRVTTLCFCVDTFFQALALLGEAEISRSSPSSLYAAYSPHPYAQLGFFVVGVMTQLLWLLKLYPVAMTTDEYEFTRLGLRRRSWSGSPRRAWVRSGTSARGARTNGEGATLLFSTDEEAQSDTNESDSVKDESHPAPDSRPGTPDDEREEPDGQILPMRPPSPTSSSKLASLPRSDAIPVIEVTSASDDDSGSDKSGTSAASLKGDTGDDEEPQEGVKSEKLVVMSERLQMRYLPHYFISTSCQVGWTCSWIMRHYDLCIVFVFINMFSQIYALFVTLDGSRNHRFPTSNILTHLTVKLRIAIAILGLWKTWGAVDVVPPPTFFEGAVNCTFFILLSGASGPDPTMGILLAIILLSLGMGRHNNIEWHRMFNWSSVIVFLFVAIDWTGGSQVRQLMCPRASNSDLDDDC